MQSCPDMDQCYIDKNHFRKDKHCVGVNSHSLTVDDIDSGYIRDKDKVLRFTTTLESFHHGDASKNLWEKNILHYKIIFVLSSITRFDWTTHVNMMDIDIYSQSLARQHIVFQMCSQPPQNHMGSVNQKSAVFSLCRLFIFSSKCSFHGFTKGICQKLNKYKEKYSQNRANRQKQHNRPSRAFVMSSITEPQTTLQNNFLPLCALQNVIIHNNEHTRTRSVLVRSDSKKV